MDRAAMMACTRYKAIVSDGNDRMRGEALRKTIEKDKAAGLIPYFVSKLVSALWCHCHICAAPSGLSRTSGGLEQIAKGGICFWT